MVNATLFINEDNREEFIGFEISGHANYAMKGYDIVCAAISTISQATVLGLKLIDENIYEYVTDDDGVLFVVFENTKKRTDLLMTILHEVLKDIQYQYSDYLELKLMTLEEYYG